MKNTATRRWGRMAAIVTAALLLAAPRLSARSNEKLVAPPDANYAGLSYGEWTAMWWQHMMSIPAAQNPMIDATGANALVDQSGPVYFLAGIWTVGGTATRTVTIPAGKALFVPVVNWIVDNGGFTLPDVPPTDFTPPQLRAMIAGVSDVKGIYASVDGKSIRDISEYQALSPVFEYDLPETGNVWEWTGWGTGYTFGDKPKGAVSNGFWLMFNPLPPGKHLLKFGVEGMDITYKLTVARP